MPSLGILRVWLSEAVRGGSRKDALHPARWLCAIVTVPAFWFSTRADWPLSLVLAAAGFVPVALFCVGYFYFMTRDADRLQSEDFVLRDRALDIIESKGGKLQISERGIHNIVKPALTDGEGVGPRPSAVEGSP